MFIYSFVYDCCSLSVFLLVYAESLQILAWQIFSCFVYTYQLITFIENNSLILSEGRYWTITAGKPDKPIVYATLNSGGCFASSQPLCYCFVFFSLSCMVDRFLVWTERRVYKAKSYPNIFKIIIIFELVTLGFRFCNSF